MSVHRLIKIDVLCLENSNGFVFENSCLVHVISTESEWEMRSAANTIFFCTVC